MLIYQWQRYILWNCAAIKNVASSVLNWSNVIKPSYGSIWIGVLIGRGCLFTALHFGYYRRLRCVMRFFNLLRCCRRERMASHSGDAVVTMSDPSGSENVNVAGSAPNCSG